MVILASFIQSVTSLVHNHNYSLVNLNPIVAYANISLMCYMPSFRSNMYF
jgi:hypothetical protein